MQTIKKAYWEDLDDLFAFLTEWATVQKCDGLLVLRVGNVTTVDKLYVAHCEMALGMKIIILFLIENENESN